jgi:membrane-bound ClpP family serine protease
LVLVALVMATADVYPGTPTLPSLPQLEVPLRNLAIGGLLAVGGAYALTLILPRTSSYRTLVSSGTSGMVSESHLARAQTAQLGREGVALSVLRPGGKAQFGAEILDVVSEGELIPKGTRVRIIRHSGREAVVESVPS